jgi:hypothetical protein
VAAEPCTDIGSSFAGDRVPNEPIVDLYRPKKTFFESPLTALAPPRVLRSQR